MENRLLENENGTFITILDEHQTRSVSYSDLYWGSLRVAAWLKPMLKDSKQALAIMPHFDSESIYTIFAVMRLNVPILFIDPKTPQARLREITSKLRIRHILCSRDVDTSGVECSLIRIPAIDQLEKFVEPRLDTEDQDKDCFYFATSGSTASSKIVGQSMRQSLANAEGLKQCHSLEGKRILTCLPLHHVNGFHFTVLGSFYSGAHSILLPKFSLFGYIHAVEKFEPDIGSVVPSILEVLAEAPSSTQLDKLGYFVSAAAPLFRVTARKIWSRYGKRVLQAYGLSETINFTTMIPPNTSQEQYEDLILENEIPSIGTAISGVDVFILDNSGRELGPNTIGEICMRGQSIMNGYYKNDIENKKCFTAGYFHSQDLGYYTLDAQSGKKFIHITGRVKNIAKIDGFTVSLEEIEHLLRNRVDLDDVICVSERSQSGVDKITVLYVSKNEIDKNTFEKALESYFPKNVYPSLYRKVDRIPRTPTGKVLRRHLM
ncbi:class I adenylate-forming enzyme family protein [Pseudobacteriovorax antillogorgiicola]|uniref:class I adenylate-forming enzyme family protein n=1 Tax=Pseudobacteriovorax antillogorgiicola TaxID=1513793 RepID=UPI00135657D1|nr:class I adenylate-forming enzyme family protein [Pseudobacteriovorax antillogorgiicola]